MSPSPLKIIVGFSPGSASDDMAHLIATPLAKALDRPVVIERIAGDNGARAACAVARSAPDGNTLFIATLGTHALAPHVRADLPYHPLRDFEPVSLLTASPMLLACPPAPPFDQVQGLITHARAHPGSLAYGTSAIGGAPHLAAEFFQLATGVSLRHARYDETQKLYADLESGHIALSFNNIMSMLPRCSTGTLRALGVTSAQRMPCAPDIPTFMECGVQDFHMSNWLGLVAPRSTPAATVASLATAIASGVLTRELAITLAENGVTPCPGSPASFAGFIADELKRWGPVVARFSRA